MVRVISKMYLSLSILVFCFEFLKYSFILVYRTTETPSLPKEFILCTSVPQLVLPYLFIGSYLVTEFRKTFVL